MEEGLLVAKGDQVAQQKQTSTSTRTSSDVSNERVLPKAGEPSLRPHGWGIVAQPGDVIVIVHSYLAPMSSGLPRFVIPSPDCYWPKPEGLSNLSDDTWRFLSLEFGTIAAKMWPNNVFVFTVAMLLLGLTCISPFYWMDQGEGGQTRSGILWLFCVFIMGLMLFIWAFRRLVDYVTSCKEEMLAKIKQVQPRVKEEGYYLILVQRGIVLGAYEVRFRPLIVPGEGEYRDMPAHERDSQWSSAIKMIQYCLSFAFIHFAAKHLLHLQS